MAERDGPGRRERGRVGPASTSAQQAENRLGQIVSGAVTETYSYDADGERISRTSAGTTTATINA